MTLAADRSRQRGILSWDVLRDIGLGIAVFDQTERLIDINAGFSALYAGIEDTIQPGTTLSQLLETIIALREVLLKQDAGSWVATALVQLRSAAPVEHESPSGRSYEITPYATSSGLALTVRDVTSLKRSEAASRQARDFADRASQSKSRFLRAASHDLRQPLATLKILIYTCQATISDISQHETLRAMDVSVSIIEDLLGALLNIGQLDGGGIIPHIDSVPVSAIFERLGIQYAHQADQKGLVLRIEPSSLVVSSDRILLERILTNLVANAIKYTNAGRVLVGCHRVGNAVDIIVCDSGPGIPAVHRERIFDEFYRIGGEEAGGAQKGLGLGLNIAQRFAELIESSISLRTIVGKGSCFSVRVPFGKVWHAAVGEADISEFLAGQFAGLEVLLVEDDLLLRDALTRLLQRWGIIVTAMPELDQAIEVFVNRKAVPDLVISDYRLPGGLRGTQVCARLRSHFGADLPCIVVTGDTDAQPLGEISVAGLPFLIKPVSPPQLRVLMHHLLYEPDMPT